MAEIKKLKANSKTLKARFTKIETYVNNHENESNCIEQLKIRKEVLATIIKEYNEVQLEIDLIDENDVENEAFFSMPEVVKIVKENHSVAEAASLALETRTIVIDTDMGNQAI
ncbi:hypothetical protein FQA39_LY16473 [Lamprigera yunnana]|nr:hypothetical protein FQA39_LY16473 [Lamprigera yunnana]